jgi:hypothetical protein
LVGQSNYHVSTQLRFYQCVDCLININLKASNQDAVLCLQMTLQLESQWHKVNAKEYTQCPMILHYASPCPHDG